MVKILADEAAIRRGERQFVKGLRAFADAKVPVTLGHPGASFRARVLWSERLGIWFFSRKMSEDRYWNVFGIGRPAPEDDISITCEINFPVRGIDRKTGGALARDNAGRIFVVHRGKIGGGRKGIGKSLFENHYRGVWATVEDGGEESTVALVGALGSPHFARQIAQFVRKIDRIKTIAESSLRPQLEIAFVEHDFREELVGADYAGGERDLGAECDRDLVVRDLFQALREQGCRVANDGRRDLFVLPAGDRSGRIAAVFAVRADSSPVALQTGIMQLLLAGLGLPGDPQLVVVAPAAAGLPVAISAEKLALLHIDLLGYEWREGRAVFPGLDALVSGLSGS